MRERLNMLVLRLEFEIGCVKLEFPGTGSPLHQMRQTSPFLAKNFDSSADLHALSFVLDNIYTEQHVTFTPHCSSCYIATVTSASPLSANAGHPPTPRLLISKALPRPRSRLHKSRRQHLLPPAFPSLRYFTCHLSSWCDL